MHVRKLQTLAHQHVWLQVVFATAVTKPGHGNIAPLAIGFTLFASAFVGGLCCLLGWFLHHFMT